jgi:hypothetical protein
MRSVSFSTMRNEADHIRAFGVTVIFIDWNPASWIGANF